VFFLCPCIIGAGEEILTGKIESSKTIIDFKSAKRLSVDSRKLSAKIKEGRLEIKSDARGGYPRVVLKPDSESWDFGNYDAVMMDIRNFGKKPVRVLLSLNNPDADGRRHCNTESVAVPAEGKAVLKVPYGMWHGNPGNDIDRSAIVSVLVMLDRPKADYHFAVDNIRAVTYERVSMEKLLNTPFYQNLEPFFGKGINLGNMLEAPREGWGVKLKDYYPEKIAKAGFDHIRIPCRWSAYAENKPPFKIEPEFFKRVDRVIKTALDNKLKVVLNMHHYNKYFENVKGHDDRFLAMWQQIAEHYSDCPEDLCFELLNEPHGNMNSAEWNRIVAGSIREIRKSNPERWIMAGPVQYNSIGKLDELRLPENDRRIVVTVHYYLPFRFTHQGAGWAGEEIGKLKNVRWRGTRKEVNAIRKDLDKAIAWAILKKRPLHLGEFGAYSKGMFEDRVLWTRCITREAEKRKMGYAYWEFCAGFGAYDPKDDKWRKPLLDAILGRD